MAVDEMGDEVVLIDSEEEEELRDSVVGRSWEEFSPRMMMMRVLLVEADDSTRQIIASLLRKCNYKVAAIPDGLKAWEILKRKHNSIDLILTEVDLPSISGYALLTLIMAHEGCRNIPVIMMSSSDSVSMIFKCMLKGAAEFLIKPVRRNELTNLWQHVWRRISQASNGSGVQHLHGGDCKVVASSENRATENCSDDNVSCSRHSQPTEKPSNGQGVAQMNYQGASNLSSNEVHQVDKCTRLTEDTEQEKSTRFESSRLAHRDEAYASTLRLERAGSSSGRTARDERIEFVGCKNMDNVPNGEFNEHARQVIDLIGTIDDHHESTIQRSTSNCEMHSSSAAPQLELSLRRSNDPNNRTADEKQKLNHSNASAFSRYSTCKSLRTSYLTSGSAEIEAGGRSNDNMVNYQDTSPKPVIAISSDEENKSTVMTGATMHSEPASPVPESRLPPIPGVGFGGMYHGYGPTYPPMFRPQVSQGTIGLKSTNPKESSPFLASTSLHSDNGTYCSSLGGHSGFDETSNNEERVASVDQPKYANGSGSQSANSTLCCGGFVAHQYQGNDYANQPMVSTDSVEDGCVRENGSNTNMLMNEQHPRARGTLQNPQREAALAKFRQKRKERCYEKKVRYQSRKRLAEQRPRVKGQFVRQVQMDQLLFDTDSLHEDDGG